jgi:hypothetical protein
MIKIMGEIKNVFISWPGANPTTVSYHASTVKIYNATSSLTRYVVRISKASIFFYFEKTL